MLNKYFTILLIIIFIGCSAQSEWIDTLPKPWLLSEDEVSEILPVFQKKYPIFEDRLKAFALWRVGTPYEIFKLGEEQEPDTDPIIRLDVSDCTGHILTSLSLVQSSCWAEAREQIIKIHYKKNESGEHIPTYESRWHFTSNRIIYHPSTVNITDDLLESENLESVNIILNKKEGGTHLLDLDWSKEVQFSYIPNESINNYLLNKLPEICGVAFIRKLYFKNGLAIAHEGMIIDQKNLIHASSAAGETVNVDFLDYYFGDDEPVFDGIMIYKFVPLR